MRKLASDLLRTMLAGLLVFALTVPAQTRSAASFDVVIRGGTVYDGSGGAAKRADVGIKGDHITAIGNLKSAKAAAVIDATGLVVAPGFINMLSHSESSLITDGRSQGELRQGVTTQIFGEGSMGPLSDEMKRRRVSGQGDLKFEIPWTTLAEYLMYLEKHGISQNAASFVSATTIRENVIGYENPHQYSVGVKHVFVNGAQVLKDGEHTGAKPGRALWSPGKVK